jgi:FSR family fosmidomycin resistance protein-like MFS transporter
MAVFLNSAVLPSENMLLARYTPRHRRGLGFGFKFVVSFSTAPLAVEFASYVQERTGEFLWLFAALAALALAAVTSALLLPAAGEKAPEPLPAE